MSSETIQETSDVADDEGEPSFFVGAWVNRRWTRSGSSLTLGLFPTALPIASGGQLPVVGSALVSAGILTPATAPLVATAVAVIAVANLLLFPFAREIYFRATAPMREGLDGIFVFGWLFLITLTLRVVMFLVIWCLAIPLGVGGILALGDEDRRGRGWRID